MSNVRRQATLALFEKLTGIKPEEVHADPITNLQIEYQIRCEALAELGEQIAKIKEVEEDTVNTKWFLMKNHKTDAEYDKYSNADSRSARVKEALQNNMAYQALVTQYKALATERDLLEKGIGHYKRAHQRTYGVPMVPIREV